MSESMTAPEPEVIACDLCGGSTVGRAIVMLCREEDGAQRFVKVHRDKYECITALAARLATAEANEAEHVRTIRGLNDARERAEVDAEARQSLGRFWLEHAEAAADVLGCEPSELKEAAADCLHHKLCAARYVEGQRVYGLLCELLGVAGDQSEVENGDWWPRIESLVSTVTRKRDAAQAALRVAHDALRDIRDNYDHEEQTHDHQPFKYGGHCRCCTATRALAAAPGETGVGT